MRISDWSSDVCSSDLRLAAGLMEGVYGLMQLIAGNGLRKTNIDHNLGRGIDFGGIVGRGFLDDIDRSETGFAAPHCHSAIAHQGVELALGEMLLHFLPHAPVLPPVKNKHDQDQ